MSQSNNVSQGGSAVVGKDEQRTEEVMEVLHAVPNLIVRWGIGIIFFWLMLLFIMSWFIKYPDKVNGVLTLTTQSPPVSIITRNQGRVHFLVNENETVKKDQYIGIISNTSNTEDVIAVLRELEEFGNTIFKDFVPEQLPDFNETVELGDVQNAYLNLIKVINEYKVFDELDMYENLFRGIEKRISYHQSLDRQLIKQMGIIRQKLDLNQKKFDVDSILQRTNVISDRDFERSKMVLLEETSQYESLNSNIINNKIIISQLESQQDELALERRQKVYNFKSSVRIAYKQLYQELKAWKEQYLLVAPCDGNISFLKFISNNRFVMSGEKIVVVVPPGQEAQGHMVIALAGSGKVKVGQEVNLKVDGYPSTEFGSLKGKVEQISLVPDDRKYYIKVSLPNGLVTTYGETLAFKQEMLAEAEIITEKQRLLLRIFNQFRDILQSVK